MAPISPAVRGPGVAVLGARGAASFAWTILLTSVGCGAPATAVSEPSALQRAARAEGLFEAGAAVGYVVKNADGRVVGRLHCRFVEQDGLRTIVSRAVYGKPALDLERLVPTRTVERATELGPDYALRRLKLLSSEDGLKTFTYDADSVVQVGPLSTGSSPNPNPRALPVHPDDPALLALLVERSGLEAGESARVAVRAEDPVHVQSWPVQVFVDRQRIRVVRMPLGEARLDGRGRIARLRLKSGLVYEQLADPGSAPELLQAPEPLVYRRPTGAQFFDRQVRIDVEDGVLAGVLSVPVQAASSGSPAVVFFSDLGPHNRHGFSGGIDAGTWQILDRLADEGFVVLRLDDRGVGRSTSSVPRPEVDVRRVVADARAVVEYLGQQPEVRSESIFAIGHGFGAYDAVAVAHDPQVRGLVMIAPPAREPVLVLAEQWTAAYGGSAAEHRQQLTRLLNAAPAARRSVTTVPPLLQRAVDDERRRLLTLPPLVEVARAVKKPVAVLQGMKDFEVSWRDDARAVVRAINGPRGDRAKLFVYEYADHLLKAETRASTPARYRDRSRRIEARALRDLVAWLTANVAG